MYNQNPYNIYKSKEIETSSPNELIAMLYGEAALSLKKAIFNINEKKLDKANNNIIKAEKIVTALNQSLDGELDISQQLNRIYNYMLRRMVEANLKKDIKILNEIADMLNDFKETWKEALKNSKAKHIS